MLLRITLRSINCIVTDNIQYHEHLIPLTREQLLNKLDHALSAGRFAHVQRVEKVAMDMAKRFGADVEAASIAGLCHDYAKQRPDEDFIAVIKQKKLDPELLNYGNAIWHGVVGAEMVKDELGVQSEDILDAIRQHTVGGTYMTKLAQIIYMADYIEPARDFEGVDRARELCQSNLGAAVAYQTKHTLEYLIENNQPVYPQTLLTYNAWVPQYRKDL